MAECMFPNAGSFMLDSYQTKKQSGTFGKSTGISQEFFAPEVNSYFTHAELDYFDEILQEHYKEPAVTPNDTTDSTVTDKCFPDFTAYKKPQLHLRQVSRSCMLLQKLQEKKINLILVATSLDNNDLVQKLEGSLDPNTSSMIPVSYDPNNNATNQVNSDLRLDSLKREDSTDDIKNSAGSNQCKKQFDSKLTNAHEKDEKYWKRRTSNNEAARRSREAKRARFLWIQKRTKELEVENASLQKELEILNRKVLKRKNIWN